MYSRLAGDVEVLNNSGIDQAVYFRDDAGKLPGTGMLGLPAYTVDEVIPQARRRQQQMMKLLRTGIARKQVE